MVHDLEATLIMCFEQDQESRTWLKTNGGGNKFHISLWATSSHDCWLEFKLNCSFFPPPPCVARKSTVLPTIFAFTAKQVLTFLCEHLAILSRTKLDHRRTVLFEHMPPFSEPSGFPVTGMLVWEKVRVCSNWRDQGWVHSADRQSQLPSRNSYFSDSHSDYKIVAI